MILQHDHFNILDKVVFQRVVFKPPFKSDLTMRDEACFFHVIKGTSRLLIPNDQIDMTASDSFVMKCGTYLNTWFKNEDDTPNEAVMVHFYPDVLKLVYDNQLPDFFTSKRKPIRRTVEKVRLNQMIKNYIGSLLFYFEHPSMVTEELIKLKVKELILLLVNTGNSEQVLTILGDLFNPEQYEFKEIIQSHLFENINLDDLATLTGLSLSSFKRKFKTIFNSSPSRYIKQQRLEKAENLLKTTMLRISDLAFDCGFNDLGHFSKSFVAAYQYTASDYRKKYIPVV